MGFALGSKENADGKNDDAKGNDSSHVFLLSEIAPPIGGRVADVVAGVGFALGGKENTDCKDYNAKGNDSSHVGSPFRLSPVCYIPY